MLRPALVAITLACALGWTAPHSSAVAQPSPSTAPWVEPAGKPWMLAHYYIWFTPSSWNRAKNDFPLAGRYSSDDVDVMRQHVAQAQAAGIQGFIVSWKSAPHLNTRLEQLIRIAEEARFKLAITYQGLDFNREPLPAPRIQADLEYFAENFAKSETFDIFGKPLVVLTGTPVMAKDVVKAITQPTRDRLLILASEKNVDSYNRIADDVDGNLYYWSSVNPRTYNGYAEKLVELGGAVRRQNKIWIAPVAPGFDARLVGGKSEVERMDGETLRTQWDAALGSKPEAIGIISWNEFSENTHVEPSERYGYDYLELLATLTGAPAPDFAGVDSSEPSGRASPARAVLALGSLGALVILSGIVRRRRRAGVATVDEAHDVR